MKLTVGQLRSIIAEEVKAASEYRNIRVGQKLFLDDLEAEVVQLDPRRIRGAGYRGGQVVGTPVQVRVVLPPNEKPTLLWVNPDQLMEIT